MMVDVGLCLDHATCDTGPDTMFSFDHATGVMYTCDAFGMHYCSEELYDSELETIAPHYRYAMCPHGGSSL